MDKSEQKPIESVVEEDNKSVPASLDDVKGTIEPATKDPEDDPIVPIDVKSGGSLKHSGNYVIKVKQLKELRLDFSDIKHI